MNPVILFDGVCNLCNGAVQFVLDRDPQQRFRFAALQSEAGAALLRQRGQEPPAPGADPDTLLLVEGERVYDRSSAALRIARHLGFPWVLAVVFWVVPRPLRDLVYRFIARNRYRWFGRSESCRLPTPALRSRFL